MEKGVETKAVTPCIHTDGMRSAEGGRAGGVGPV